SSRNDLGTGVGESGAVYVYDLASGNLLHKLIPDDPQSGSQFGNSVAIEGNLIAIGAPFTGDRGINTGSVYIFDAITGNQITKIIADDTERLDWFGISVALDSDILVIGAVNTQVPGGGEGSVYIYDINTFTMIDKVNIPVVSGVNDRFGYEVAASEGDILTSNYNQVENGLGTGVAYFIDAICSADLNGDGSLDFFDISAMINTQPDYNGDGVFNFFDISAFLSDLNMGCP
ncbi:MAG: FG-GAP repeat protein, partial [Phycisphaerales bacterium]|nr:FG-GAP repeat protein [Phycisphaerales bacterium]